MKTKLLSAVAACVLALHVSAASADTYTFTGMFSDGGTLTGSLRLDDSETPLRGILEVQTSLPNTEGLGGFKADTYFSIGGPDPDYGPGFLTEFGVANYGSLHLTRLHLTFNLTTILTGSIIWPDECANTSPPFCLGGQFNLVSGSLTPAAVPLPAALPLFATGLGALVLLTRRRRKS